MHITSWTPQHGTCTACIIYHVCTGCVTHDAGPMQSGVTQVFFLTQLTAVTVTVCTVCTKRVFLAARLFVCLFICSSKGSERLASFQFCPVLIRDIGFSSSCIHWTHVFSQGLAHTVLSCSLHECQVLKLTTACTECRAEATADTRTCCSCFGFDEGSLIICAK